MSRDGRGRRRLHTSCCRRPRRVAPCRRRPCEHPRPDTFHRARPAVAAVGLGRRPPNESDRLPSARHRTFRPDAGSARMLFTCVASPSTLSLAANPAAAEPKLLERRPASSKAVGSPPAIPRSAVDLPAVADVSARAAREQDAPHRLLQPTFLHEHQRTARLLADPRSAPPCGDLTMRGPDSPSAPRRAPRGERVREPALRGRMSRPGGASLDGEPPASTILVARARLRGFRPSLTLRHLWSWRSRDRGLLPFGASRLGRCSRRSGDCDDRL